jgi:putative Mg2+ transporter-C (MgtC) family protein
MISAKAFGLYRSSEVLVANAFIGLNLLGALTLGTLVGFERSYNGRAAGMRTARPIAQRLP